MPHTNKLHLAFMNLNEELPLNSYGGHFGKSGGLKMLQEITGQDFGYDVEAWREWINENRPGALPKSDMQIRKQSTENNTPIQI